MLNDADRGSHAPTANAKAKPLSFNLEVSTGPSKGANDSIIREFTIEKLYGYRSIGLASPFAATILIAKNGTGKTTLMGALDAFLRLQLGRLRGLDFSTIRCRLDGIEEELVLHHEDVISFLQIPSENDFLRTASRASVEPKRLFTYILDEFTQTSRRERLSLDNPVYSALLQSYGYDYAEVDKTLEALVEFVYGRNKNVFLIRSALRKRLKDIQIVYLPTYRRVELALTDDDETPSHRRKRSSKFPIAAGSLFTGDIQFGLGDISERLREINSEIIQSSNIGYREISANIISDLIDAPFDEVGELNEDTPSKGDLDIFFSRLKEGRRNGRFPQVKAPDLDKLYEWEDIPTSSQPFLRYFLNQLGMVIKSTKSLEEPVSLFRDSCNKYLLSEEPSTVLDHMEYGTLADRKVGKKLCVNKQNLSVHVESVPKGRKIFLNSLSSGEKQMISLFAKLFLYPKDKIVLIDEPELSLSIDWQSQILVDVLNAPLCKQVIAITHSPFVFDNELDPFARPILVSDEDSEDGEQFDDFDFGSVDDE